MSEYISNPYKRLFEIRLLHHYWLDDGAVVFDLISPQEKRDKRLLSYDVRSILMVKPTSTAAKTLKSLGCVFKSTSLGCIVAVPETTKVPNDVIFEFILTVKDPDFYNYTALTLRARKIYQFYYQPEKKDYRYKENVPILSNLTGGSRPDLGNALFLSKEFPALANDDEVESLFLSGTALNQLTSDQTGAGAASQELHTLATNLPIYVHQGDVPTIVPPTGLIGTPVRGILLTDDIPDDVFALIRLSAVSGIGGFSFVDSNGYVKTTPPVFEIRFKNRSTIWKYIEKSSGTVQPIDPSILPLTHYGNAGLKQKPPQGLIKPEKDKNNGKITQLVSEIFV